MIIFVDPKSGRGGGQVVLETLLAMTCEIAQVALAMPSSGRDAIKVPSGVSWAGSLEQVLAGCPSSEPVVIVANANSSFPAVAARGFRLRRQGRRLTTVGIVHNYPSTRLKRIATIQSLKQLDHTIVVEPGLASLCPDAQVPSWLSMPDGFPVDLATNVTQTGVVKSYARPDETKGLHLLPEIFMRLEAAGLECRVALGVPLDGQDAYAKTLRRDLQRWLEPGHRSHVWIEPGDVFLVPSVSGEAACLSAQEAMSHGAWVVASRLGLMPYLSPAGEAVTTFPVASVDQAVRRILDVQALPTADFATAVGRSQRSIRDRRVLWHREVLSTLRQIHASLETR